MSRDEKNKANLGLALLITAVLILIVLIVIFVPLPHAAYAADGKVSIQPIYDSFINPLINALLEGLALAIAGWVTFLIQRYAPKFLSGFLEAKASNDLNTALQNGIMVAMNQLKAFESVHKDVAVQGMVQRMAVQYAIDHAPGAIDHFGLSPDQLANKALAFIPTPQLLSDSSGVTINQPEKVQVTNLEAPKS